MSISSEAIDPIMKTEGSKKNKKNWPMITMFTDYLIAGLIVKKFRAKKS